jgi:hypothetical protein
LKILAGLDRRAAAAIGHADHDCEGARRAVIALQGRRRLIAAQRIASPGRSAVLPVRAWLDVRIERASRVVLRGGASTPLDALVLSGKQRWHSVPVAARGPIRLAAALLTGDPRRSRHLRATMRHTGETATVNPDARNSVRAEETGTTSDDRLLAAVGRGRGGDDRRLAGRRRSPRSGDRSGGVCS